MTILDIHAESDVMLLRATAQGNRQALAQLYGRHGPWLVLRLSRRCADAGIVDEVIQDAFVAVWRNAAQMGLKGEVAAWIWGIAMRRLADAQRRRPVPQPSLEELPDWAGTTAPSAEDQALASGGYGDIAGALNRLPADLLAVVRATVIDGLSSREAARLLGIPVGTVKPG